ncbi:MAG: hypothetical protein JWN22_3767 [Nocardioides sp.]|nr:hypothetical protein [Nocardioides sp.]
MTPTHRNWQVTTDHRVKDQHDPETGDWIGTEEVMGGVVHDPDRGVLYRVTLGRRRQGKGDSERGVTHREPVGSGPAVWLASLTIEPRNGAPVDAAMLRRVPVQRLAEAVATQYAREAALWAGDDDEPLPSEVSLRGDVPTSEQVEAMLLGGETRQTIAARYSRSPSTVSDWIGRAYRERPQTMPPRRRGRSPKNPGTDAGSRERKGHK